MVSVGHILEGAFGLIRERFTAVAIWAGVYLAASIATVLAVRPMAARMTDPATASDPSALIGAMLPVYAMNLLLVLVGIVLYTAAMRAVLRPQAGGLGYLRLGGDELRMLVLAILFGIFGIVLGVGFAMLFALVTAGAAAGSNSAGVTILVAFVGGLAVFVLFLFLTIRFSLAFPLTLHRRRLVIGEAWSLSRGRFWTLFGAALVVTLIGMVMWTIVATFAMGSYMADIVAASGDPEAAATLAERQLSSSGSLGTALIAQTVVSAIVGAIWFALSGGSAATATRLMLAEEFDDAETVFG